LLATGRERRCVYTVDFEGGNIDEVVDGIIHDDDVTLPIFFCKSDFLLSILDWLATF